MLMARERERVFSLSKFSTQASMDETEPNEGGSGTFSNIFSRIYGDANVDPKANGKRRTADDDSEVDYVEPERTSYPQQAGIVGFGQVPRAKKGDMDLEMEFS